MARLQATEKLADTVQTLNLQADIEGNCVFCSQELRLRPEARSLPCNHQTCTGCLKETLAGGQNFRCATCRKEHVDLELDHCSIVYRRTVFLCTGQGCRKDSTRFCSKCQMTYCAVHLRAHVDAQSDHHDSVIPIAQYKQEIDRHTPRMCAQHRKQEVTKSCSICKRQFCPFCIQTGQCAENTAGHSIKRLDEVATSVREALLNDVEHLLAFDRQLGDEMVLIDDRTELLTKKEKEMNDKLNNATEKAIREITETAEGLAIEIQLKFKNVRDRLKDLKLDLDPVQKSAETLLVTAIDVAARNDSDIIREQPNMTKAINNYYITIPSAASIPFCQYPEPEDGMNFRWRFKVVEMSIAHKEDIATADRCHTVCHLPNGKLVCGGRFGLSGLGRAPQIEGWVGHTVWDEYTTNLFVLSIKDDELMLFEIEPDTSWSQCLIKYPDKSKLIPNVAVNVQYILITDNPTDTIKVYSRMSYELLFTMQLTVNCNLSGVHLLTDESVIFTDLDNNIVQCVSIENPPQVLWSAKYAYRPMGIHLDKVKEVIFVCCNEGDRIYVISFQGESLATLKISEGKKYITDISVHGDEIAVANRDEGVRKFNIVYK